MHVEDYPLMLRFALRLSITYMGSPVRNYRSRNLFPFAYRDFRSTIRRLRFFVCKKSGKIRVRNILRTCDCSGRRAASPKSLQPLLTATDNFGGCLGAERQLSRATCSTCAFIRGISDVECCVIVKEAPEYPCCSRIPFVRWCSLRLAALAGRCRQQVL